MALTIMYLVEDVDDCAHTKCEVAPTNVSVCVCVNEFAYLHTLLHFYESLSQEDDNQRLQRLLCFLTTLGRSGHTYESERVDNLHTYLV